MTSRSAIAIFLSATALGATPLSAQDDAVTPQTPKPLTLDAGVPLHLVVDHTVRIRKGRAVEGQLTTPIYIVDRLALPAGTHFSGTIESVIPIHGLVRTQALLNGDVSPLHEPVVHISSLRLPNGETVRLDADARLRETQMVNFTPAGKRPSLFKQAKTAVTDRIQSTRDTLFGPNKKDRALRAFYGQLPYHPQDLWAGSKLIADLNTTALVPVAEAPLTLASADAHGLDGLDITARLCTDLTSATARKGQDVTAVATTPILAPDHTVLLAEGTLLRGVVQSSRPARSFGRNGELRFTIRSVERKGVAAEHVFGTLAGAEGAKGANTTIDSEGNVKSNPEKDRFVAPIVLGVLAFAGHDHDRDHGDGGGGIGGQTVASNGFGLIARVLALTLQNANVATGFGVYAVAKSVTFRFLLKGHEVAFPTDTLVKVRLNAR